MISSPNRNTIYTGVTSNLYKRIYEHRSKHFPDSFTAKYNCVQLVYYRLCDTITQAIHEEKKIKRLLRVEKERMILAFNPEWRDLWTEIGLL